MVDPTVVVVENIFQRLGQARGTGESKFEIIVKATAEVGTPVIFGIIVIILVFLPLMTLHGMEGKMFSPLAITIAISLMVALIVSVLLSPVLSAYILKGGSEKDTKIVAVLKSIYLRVLNGGAWRRRKPLMAIALGLLSLTFVLYPVAWQIIHSGNERRLDNACDHPGTIDFARGIDQAGSRGDETDRGQCPG